MGIKESEQMRDDGLEALSSHLIFRDLLQLRYCLRRSDAFSDIWTKDVYVIPIESETDDR